MFMAFALCFAGFVSTAHAVFDSDHFLHGANVKYDCKDSTTSKVASKQSEKSNSGSGFCEAACHAPLGFNMPLTVDKIITFVETSVVFYADEVIASNISATPDQPPRIS